MHFRISCGWCMAFWLLFLPTSGMAKQEKREETIERIETVVRKMAVAIPNFQFPWAREQVHVRFIESKVSARITLTKFIYDTHTVYSYDIDIPRHYKSKFRLTTDELIAICAHELGHVANEDTEDDGKISDEDMLCRQYMADKSAVLLLEYAGLDPVVLINALKKLKQPRERIAILREFISRKKH